MADPNIENPLVLRTIDGTLDPNQQDDNFRNLERFAGGWNVGRIPYVKNEVVFHQGAMWIAIAPTREEPGSDAQTGWVPMTLLSGRGGMKMTSPTAAPDLTAGWIPVTEYDENHITSLGTTFDFVTGEFTLDYRGLWQIAINWTFETDNSQQARETGIRLFDVTAAAAGTPGIIGVGRNSVVTPYSTSVFFEVRDAQLGNTIRIEVGGGDAIPVTDYTNLNISAIQSGV
jgi:hypothetical protein